MPYFLSFYKHLNPSDSLLLKFPLCCQCLVKFIKNLRHFSTKELVHSATSAFFIKGCIVEVFDFDVVRIYYMVFEFTQPVHLFGCKAVVFSCMLLKNPFIKIVVNRFVKGVQFALSMPQALRMSETKAVSSSIG
jgi:hypothetical protein